jgi:hypothetical protein
LLRIHPEVTPLKACEIHAASMGDAAGPGEFLFTMTNNNADSMTQASHIRDEFRKP